MPMPTIETSACVVYANGLCSCSICAPKAWTPERIEEEVNTINPTGISSRWKISSDTKFHTGQPMPCPCNDPGAERLHWLMEC